MKSVFISGQQTEAPCERCGKFVVATYGYGNIALADGTLVAHVMRACCDSCGEIVALAPQSAHRIRESREAAYKKRTSVRLPYELVDFLAYRAASAGGSGGNADLVLRCMLTAAAGQETKLGLLLSKLQDEILNRRNEETVNVTMSPRLCEVLERLKLASKLPSTSVVLRRLIVLADQEPFSEMVYDELVRAISMRGEGIGLGPQTVAVGTRRYP